MMTVMMIDAAMCFSTLPASWEFVTFMSGPLISSAWTHASKQGAFMNEATTPLVHIHTYIHTFEFPANTQVPFIVEVAWPRLVAVIKERRKRVGVCNPYSINA